MAHLARALENGARAGIEAEIADDYSDPLGGRQELLDDLQAIFHATERRSIALADLEVLAAESSLTAIEVIGKQVIEVEGRPSWKLVGPLHLELARSDLRVRSGVLDDLRGIRALFAARRAALEANDAAGIGVLLHPQYRDGDRTREETVARLGSDLAGLPIRFEPLSYWAEVRGIEAHVDERYRMSVGTASATPALVGRFTLRRSAGRWRIAGGLY